jgi:hypothetical protein
MKNLLVSILISLTPLAALSQTEVRFPATCVSLKNLVEVVSEFKEEPSLSMISNRQIDGKILEFKSVMFVNFKTQTWTLAEQIGKDTFCVTATGEGIKPVVDK